MKFYQNKNTNFFVNYRITLYITKSLILVTFGMTSPTHYYYTKVMKDLFSKQPKVKYLPNYNFFTVLI